MSDARLKFHATKGVPHGSYTTKEIADEHARRKKTGGAEYAAVKPSLSEESEQIDEISRDLARRYIRKASAYKTTGETPKKDRSTGIITAGKKAYGITGNARVPATESFELDEAFKAGSLKLNDGSSVSIKNEDAKLLNQLINGLRAENAKKMMKVAMSDKDGFNEILGFAREAL